MSASNRKKLGNFRIVPRSQDTPPKKRKRRASSQPVRFSEAFDKRVASVYASWNCGRKIKSSVGRYASRPIANVANGTQKPARDLSRHAMDAIDADNPLEKVEQFGWEYIAFVREYHARTRGKVSAALVA